MTAAVDQNVLGLEVAVHVPAAVEVLEREENLRGVEHHRGRRERAFIGTVDQQLEQVAPGHEIHHEVEVSGVLKRTQRLHHERRVAERSHQRALAHDVLRLVQTEELALGHHLDAAVRVTQVGGARQVDLAGHADAKLLVKR